MAISWIRASLYGRQARHGEPALELDCGFASGFPACPRSGPGRFRPVVKPQIRAAKMSYPLGTPGAFVGSAQSRGRTDSASSDRQTGLGITKCGGFIGSTPRTPRRVKRLGHLAAPWPIVRLLSVLPPPRRGALALAANARMNPTFGKLDLSNHPADVSHRTIARQPSNDRHQLCYNCKALLN